LARWIARFTTDGLTPYFGHPEAVAIILLEYLRVRDANVIASAILHDNVEDLPHLGWSNEYIRKEYNQDIAELVWWVTKFDLADFGGNKKERDAMYHVHLRSAPRRAIMIKLADRLHNIMTLWAHDIEKQRRKIQETLHFYLPRAEEHTILQPIYGGANAKPFVTHHNALDLKLYLRIAPELYLKRLIVGGFEKVYEVARCFRNEGIDHNHNPEFTQIEYYWAYADYNNSMNLVEELLPYLIKQLGLPLKFTTEEGEVDFTPPYPRKTMRALIKEFAKIDIEDYPDQKTLLKKAKELKVEVEDYEGRGKLIDEIYKKYARPFIKNPIFMTDHPVELSPLAKRKKDDERYTERFQLLCAGGNELCNAFSELNDPLDQEARFKEQEQLREAGDEEGMQFDEDFITALKHGMPPTSGLGMGIDRLVKLLVNAPNLKEVILFPLLRPEK
jgi:lysyl-tRNA synthetase class 2